MTSRRRKEEIMVIVIPDKVKVGDRDGIWHRISSTLCDVLNELSRGEICAANFIPPCKK